MGLSHSLSDLAGWDYIPCSGWRISGIVYTLALANTEEPHRDPPATQLYVHAWFSVLREWFQLSQPRSPHLYHGADTGLPSWGYGVADTRPLVCSVALVGCLNLSVLRCPHL